jgi:hypothetical protein
MCRVFVGRRTRSSALLTGGGIHLVELQASKRVRLVHVHFVGGVELIAALRGIGGIASVSP